MSALPDNTLLSYICLPGSHDSATAHTKSTGVISGAVSRVCEAINCQNLSIWEQLEAGVRFLDLRLCPEKDALNITQFICVHGKGVLRYTCKSPHGEWDLNFEEVKTNCQTFLQAHPNETIVVSIKKEDGEDTLMGELDKPFLRTCGKPSLLLRPGPIGSTPAFGTQTPPFRPWARCAASWYWYGALRCLTAWRILESIFRVGIPFETAMEAFGYSTFPKATHLCRINTILGIHRLPDVVAEDKWEHWVKPAFEDFKKSRLPHSIQINCTSCTNLRNVPGSAGALNPRLMDYLTAQPMNSFHCWVASDYVTEELCRAIFSMNDPGAVL